MPPPPKQPSHPGTNHKARTPGPQAGQPDRSKDGPGPVGQKKKAAPKSPLLLNGPITITSDILREIVNVTKLDVGAVVNNLNTTIQLAEIKTALAEAMLIAQLVVESAGFTKEKVVEGGVKANEVYNPDDTVPVTFKLPSPVFGVDKATKKPVLARYLHQKAQVTLWEASRAKYGQEKAVFLKAQPGKDFDAANLWKPLPPTGYLPGDVELPRWKLLYDVDSPRASRAKMAKANGNVNSGDGLKYIGRGYIQLTWQVNYKNAGKFVGEDLAANYDRAADPVVSVKVSAWFWKTHGCNHKASADTYAAFRAVTRAINGGEVGLAQRWTSYKTIKAVFLKLLPAVPGADAADKPATPPAAGAPAAKPVPPVVRPPAAAPAPK